MSKITVLTIVAAVSAMVSLPGLALADVEVGISDFQGTNGPSEEGVYLARTVEEWERLWALVGETPKVDLKSGKESGVGLFLGTRPKGEEVRVRKAQDDDGRLEVKATWTKASDGTGETVTPWAIVLIRADGKKAVVDLRLAAETVP